MVFSNPVTNNKPEPIVFLEFPMIFTHYSLLILFPCYHIHISQGVVNYNADILSRLILEDAWPCCKTRGGECKGMY